MPSPPPPDVSVTVTVSTVLVVTVARVPLPWLADVAVSAVDGTSSSLLATSKMPRLVVVELLLLLPSVVEVDEVLKKIGAPGSRTLPSVESSSPRPLS